MTIKRDRYSVTLNNILAVTQAGETYTASEIQGMLNDYRPKITSGYKPRSYSHNFHPCTNYIAYVLRRAQHFAKVTLSRGRHTWQRKEESE